MYTFKNKFTSLCPPSVSSTLSLIENLISIAGLVTGFFCCSVVPPASYEQGDGPTLPPPLPRQAGGQNQNNMKKDSNKIPLTGHNDKHRGAVDTTVMSAETMHSSNDDYHLYKNQHSTHTLIHQIQPGGTAGNIYICAPEELLTQQSPSVSPTSPLPGMIRGSPSSPEDGGSSSSPMSKPWMASPGSHCFVSSSSSGTSRSGNNHQTTSDRYVTYLHSIHVTKIWLN